MDTIGDFCTCIRNAAFAGKEKLNIPSSNIRQKIADKLQQYGYIRGYRVVDDGRQGLMRIYLKYDEKAVPGHQLYSKSEPPFVPPLCESGRN